MTEPTGNSTQRNNEPPINQPQYYPPTHFFAPQNGGAPPQPYGGGPYTPQYSQYAVPQPYYGMPYGYPPAPVPTDPSQAPPLNPTQPSNQDTGDAPLFGPSLPPSETVQPLYGPVAPVYPQPYTDPYGVPYMYGAPPGMVPYSPTYYPPPHAVSPTHQPQGSDHAQHERNHKGPKASKAPKAPKAPRAAPSAQSSTRPATTYTESRVVPAPVRNSYMTISSGTNMSANFGNDDISLDNNEYVMLGGNARNTKTESSPQTKIPCWKMALRVILRLQDLYSENLKVVWLITLMILWLDLATSEAPQRLLLTPYAEATLCFPSPLAASWRGEVCIHPPVKSAKESIACTRFTDAFPERYRKPARPAAPWGGLECQTTTWWKDNNAPAPMLDPTRLQVDSRWHSFLVEHVYEDYTETIAGTGGWRRRYEGVYFVHTGMVLLWQIVAGFLMGVEAFRVSIYFIFKAIWSPNTYDGDDLDANHENQFMGCIDCGMPVLEAFRYSPFIFLFFIFRPVRCIQFFVEERKDEKPIESYFIRLLSYALTLLHGAVVLFTAIYVETSVYLVIPPLLSIAKSLGRLVWDCYNRAQEDMRTLR